MSDTASPGWYHAEGDPPGTVRYWDGTMWSGAPVPMPGGQTGSPGAPLDRDRFGGLGVRMGAGLIDLVIYIAVIGVAIAAAIGISGEDDAGLAVVGAVAAASIGLYALFVIMTAHRGGSPGKLAVGLRVTAEDGETTPPGFRLAFVRTVPSFVAFAPIIGGLLSFGLLILNIVWVQTDDERRSAHDRFGGTRVVRKSLLS